MSKKRNRPVVVFAGLLAAAAFFSAPIGTDAHAQTVTLKEKCANAVCGGMKYYGGRVRISVRSLLSRTTHFNFKTNPGDQIELASNERGRGGYSFDVEPGAAGTYSVQACERGGIGARSTCSRWATFNWNSGEQDEVEAQ